MVITSQIPSHRRGHANGNLDRLQVQVSWEAPDGIKRQGRQEQQEGSGSEPQGEAAGQEGEEGRAESLSDHPAPAAGTHGLFKALKAGESGASRFN